MQDELRLAREECVKERNASIETELALAEVRAQKTLHEQRAQDLAASLASALSLRFRSSRRGTPN